MVDGWEWDDTLFLGSAQYYDRGRLPYAPGLADTLTEALTLDGRGRLIDVGCGPGTLALSLAHGFSKVVGVDPDSGMIAEAGRRAAEAGVTGKTRWVQIRAEELPADLGTFTVATFGQSFHWMDQDLVAATVRDMLEPGGVLVHVSDLKDSKDLKDLEDLEDLKTQQRAVDGLPHPPVPYAAVEDLIKKYLGPVRRAGRGFLPHGTPGGEAAVLSRAGFAGPSRYVVPGGEAVDRTHGDVLAWVFSRSLSTPHQFGSLRGDFEADLERLLSRSAPAGRFSERQPSTEVFVWHKTARASAVQAS
jgi:SAM-dependent methyltransferase